MRNGIDYDAFVHYCASTVALTDESMNTRSRQLTAEHNGTLTTLRMSEVDSRTGERREATVITQAREHIDLALEDRGHEMILER